jgi:predicted DNA binding CopG/RHH family protein
MTPKTKKLKPIPTFANEDEEREFWEINDSTEYIDWNQAVVTTFPNLRPSTKTISIRLPESLIDSLKVLAHKQDVGYQSLIKMLLSEHVARELASPSNTQ